MESQESRWIVAALSRRSGTSGQAAQTAAALLSLWAEISSSLQSIIGRQGVAALYDRSVSLSARRHLWLAAARAGPSHEDNLVALQKAVSGQNAARAAAGSAEFMQQFYELLVSLIGSSLSDQLLAPVREGGPHRPTPDF